MCKRCGINHATEFVNTVDGFREYCPYVAEQLRKDTPPYMQIYCMVWLVITGCMNYDPATGTVDIFSAVVYAMLYGAIVFVPLSLAIIILSPIIQRLKS